MNKSKGGLAMTSISRREFSSAASFGLASFIASERLASAATPQNWDDPSERLHTMIRIMGRTDGGVAIRWMKGVLSGIVNQETKQLLGVSQQIFTRHQRKEDGSFDALYLELVYFSKLETGKVIDKWNNPYTGRTVTVPTQSLGPTRINIPLSLRVINEPYAMEGIVNKHWLEPLPIEGDDICFNERIDSYVPPMTKDGAPIKFHEVFAFRASSRLLTDRSLAHVPATVDKVNVISWRPWMDMAEVDGVTMSRGAGRVIVNYNELPADLIQKNKEFFPDVIENMEDYLKF
jgi:hypothetical protein